MGLLWDRITYFKTAAMFSKLSVFLYILEAVLCMPLTDTLLSHWKLSTKQANTMQSCIGENVANTSSSRLQSVQLKFKI